MPQDNVQAIVHLVLSAASVENLSSSNITVSDTMGHLLYSGGQDSSFTSGQNTAQTQTYEDGVRQQVLQQLNSVLGPGHAAVAVSATLDFTQGTSQTTTNTPVVDKKGNPIAGTTSNDDTKLTQPAGSSSTGGILGANTTGTGAATTGGTTTSSGGTENYSENNDQKQNIVDQTTSKTTNPPFSVTNLSVSVGLDQSKVSAAQLPTLRNLIAAATGINPAVANRQRTSSWWPALR